MSERTAQKRILVIDDEPSMLKIVQFGLVHARYRVTVAASGWEGLREFQREPFDLVISDRAMPEMSGDELAGAIKATSPDTPIILISGVAEIPVNTTLFAAFLQKPFTMTELITTVSDILPAAA